MADFSYIAIDKSGKIKRGVLSSLTSEQTSKVLASQGLELISCEEKEKEAFGLNLDVIDFFKAIFFRQITSLEKISFAHHLAVMLKAGVPIMEAVEVLESETATPKFRKTIKHLIIELEKGKNLSVLLEKEKVFSPSHLAILKAGETSGKIIDSLLRIGIDLKRDYQLRKKLKGAMAYPMVITLTLLAVSGFIVLFVLPKVGDVFKQMKLKIPLPTRILLFIGSFISQYFLEMLIAFVLLTSILFFIFKRLNFGKEVFSRTVRFIPVIKKIVYQLSMARFIRSLSSLLSSGVPIAEALTISKGIFIDKRHKLAIEKICEKVKNGVSLTEAFKAYHEYFEVMLVKMCSVGEKSGNLAPILEELAIFYEEEVNDKLDNFSTIVEPILMLLVGLGVGGMIFSIIGPIYQMMGKLNQ
jgi:type IV pilus assembly protein PilC